MDSKLRSKGITATACMEAQLQLLFSDRDFLPYVQHLGLKAAWLSRVSP